MWGGRGADEYEIAHLSTFLFSSMSQSGEEEPSTSMSTLVL